MSSPDNLLEPLLPAMLSINVSSRAPQEYPQALLEPWVLAQTKFAVQYSKLRLEEVSYSSAWLFWGAWRSLSRLCSFALFCWWHQFMQFFEACNAINPCFICVVSRRMKMVFGSLNMRYRLRQRLLPWLGGFDVYILYHTAKMGRLNLTNVLDSLYDWYLSYLAVRKGHERVIILLDDLHDPEAAKQTIEENQPTAVKCSGNIFCFKSRGEHESDIWNNTEMKRFDHYLEQIFLNQNKN
ncbi:uncharacterized protein LOC122798903 [Protopterus annectens]|uniref:uncharacterized protein LOC122798903 n=1 Tax=Protopterus annectens TaxID=7888 RepID=UPI001CF9A4F4|nr:uncharacterized protein LOC122798903 [Protopterus annectens]